MLYSPLSTLLMGSPLMVLRIKLLHRRDTLISLTTVAGAVAEAADFLVAAGNVAATASSPRTREHHNNIHGMGLLTTPIIMGHTYMHMGLLFHMVLLLHGPLFGAHTLQPSRAELAPPTHARPAWAKASPIICCYRGA